MNSQNRHQHTTQSRCHENWYCAAHTHEWHPGSRPLCRYIWNTAAISY
jgi:hypothetical protein